MELLAKPSAFVVANPCVRKAILRGFCNASSMNPGYGYGSRTLATLNTSNQAVLNFTTWPMESRRRHVQIHELSSNGRRSLSSKTEDEMLNKSGKIIQTEVEKNLKTMREGTYDKHVTNPEALQHFRSPQNAELKGTEQEPEIGANALPHPIWKNDDLHSVEITHMEPKGIIDRMAFTAVKLLRFGFDVFSGYNRRIRDEKVWLNRICFLETVAGVPGMVAAMVRHLHSLRRMRRDHGWIHTLLEEAENERMHLMLALQLKHPSLLFRWSVVIVQEEAENERMHLMTALQLKQPSFLFRWSVMATQGIFVGGFSIAYLLSPKFCHRFVGYLEEEAVVTYTKLLKDIEDGPMQHWKTQDAPAMAVAYWKLPVDATMKDVVLAIRADEAHHRVVNHTLGSMKPDDYNPYKPGK